MLLYVYRYRPHMTPTGRLVMPNMHLEAMVLKRHLAIIGNRARQKMVLNVRPLDSGSGPDKRARFKVIRSA